MYNFIAGEEGRKSEKEQELDLEIAEASEDSVGGHEEQIKYYFRGPGKNVPIEDVPMNIRKRVIQERKFEKKTHQDRES